MKAMIVGVALGVVLYSLPIAARYAATAYELVFTNRTSLTDRAVEEALDRVFVWWMRDFLGPRYEEWRRLPMQQHLPLPSWQEAITECDRVTSEARRTARANTLEVCLRENNRRAGLGG